MIVYHYHPTTGEHVGSSLARKSPKEPGVFLAPARATFVPPPFLPDVHHAAVFDVATEQWAIVENHRGKPCWDTDTKQPVVIAELGPLPPGVTLLAPSPYQVWVDGQWVTNTESVQAAKEKKKQALAEERYKREVGGVIVAGTMVRTDRDSQDALIRAMARAQRKPGGPINWKAGNGWVRLSKVELEVVASAVDDHVQACFDNEMAHATAIDALTEIPDIEGYDIMMGWAGE